MAFAGRMKELDVLCQEGRSMAPLGGPRVSLPGASGVSFPCFHLELELCDPNKLGHPYVYGHCLLPGGHLVILLVKLLYPLPFAILSAFALPCSV